MHVTNKLCILVNISGFITGIFIRDSCTNSKMDNKLLHIKNNYPPKLVSNKIQSILRDKKSEKLRYEGQQKGQIIYLIIKALMKL